MRLSGSPGTQETANFVELVDKFFDCLNGINLYDKKPARRGYVSIHDDRFKVSIAQHYVLLWSGTMLFFFPQFLEETFLGYLVDWKKRVDDQRLTGLSATECNKMFISQQTYEGIRITGGN